MLKRSLLLTLLPLLAHAEELPAPVKAIEKQGITIIKPFDAPAGMKGYLGKYQDMGVAIYVTPDGKHAISGYMYDEKGQNLSEQLFQKEIYTPAGQEMWKRMEKARGYWTVKKTRRSNCMYLPIRSALIASSSGSRLARGSMREKFSFARYWLALSSQKARTLLRQSWRRKIPPKPGMTMNNPAGR